MYEWYPVCRHLGLIFKVAVIRPMSFLNYAKVKCRDTVKCGHASLEPVSPVRRQHETHGVKQTITANKTPYFNLISTWNWRWAHPKYLFQSSTAQNGSLPNKPATTGGLFVSYLSHRFTKIRINLKKNPQKKKENADFCISSVSTLNINLTPLYHHRRTLLSSPKDRNQTLLFHFHSAVRSGCDLVHLCNHSLSATPQNNCLTH